MFRQMLIWAAIAMATSPIWGALLWEFREGCIRSRLIRASDVDALAAAMLDRHGDRAEEMAFSEEDRAWRYSDTFEQGKWRRVRKRIETMQDHRKRLCRNAYDDTSALREKKFDNSINPL